MPGVTTTVVIPNEELKTNDTAPFITGSGSDVNSVVIDVGICHGGGYLACGLDTIEGNIDIPSGVDSFVSFIVPNMDCQPNSLIIYRGAVPVNIVGRGVIISNVMPIAVIPHMEFHIVDTTFVIIGFCLDGNEIRVGRPT
jgi:hypothetical protein